MLSSIIRRVRHPSVRQHLTHSFNVRVLDYTKIYAADQWQSAAFQIFLYVTNSYPHCS